MIAISEPYHSLFSLHFNEPYSSARLNHTDIKEKELNFSKFGWSIWFKREKSFFPKEFGGLQVLFNKGNTIPAEGGMYIIINQQNRLRIQINSQNETTLVLEPWARIMNSEWYHLYFKFNSLSNLDHERGQIYLNGNEIYEYHKIERLSRYSSMMSIPAFKWEWGSALRTKCSFHGKMYQPTFFNNTLPDIKDIIYIDKLKPKNISKLRGLHSSIRINEKRILYDDGLNLEWTNYTNIIKASRDIPGLPESSV